MPAGARQWPSRGPAQAAAGRVAAGRGRGRPRCAADLGANVLAEPAKRAIDAPPSEPLRSGRGVRAPSRGDARSEPGPVLRPTRRSGAVILVSGLAGETGGRCRLGHRSPGRPGAGTVRPGRGWGPGRTGCRQRIEEDRISRLNTEPPSRDRPMLELPNPEMRSLLEPGLLNQVGWSSSLLSRARRAEPRRAAAAPGSRAAEQRAAEHTLAAPAAEPDPGRAHAEPGRGERRAQAGRGRCPGRPSLSWGSRRAVGRTLPRAAQAADRARAPCPARTAAAAARSRRPAA